MKRTVLVALVSALFVLIPMTEALPQQSRSAAIAGAHRLLDVQFEDGSFPWIVGQPGKYQNVQGITALGLLSAYQVSLDEAFLGNETAGAQGTRNWLAAYMDANPSAFISASNIYFLAEYAILTGDSEAHDLAEAAMLRAIDRFGNAEGIVDGILQARVNPYGNLGVWDVALFIRAASDIGWEETADAMAARLATTTIVDLFDNTTNFYEMGLAGVLFGLGEADLVAHLDIVTQARDALLASQCDNASFPTTWQGIVYCDDVQSTAYAVIGLTWAMESALTTNGPCSFLIAQQGTEHGWDLGGYEIAEVDSEAVIALAACFAPINNGATSYADPVRIALS